MKIITRITLSCVAFAAAAFARAQSTVYDGASSGTLGQRYGEFNFGLTDFRNYSPNFYDLNIGSNVPLTRNLDLGASFAHGWFGDGAPGSGNGLGTSLTAYLNREGAKPFVTAGVGYQWWNRAGEDLWVWSGTAGLQVPFGRLALTPRLSFSDDFRRSARSTQQVTVETEGNYWLNQRTNVFLTVGYTDVHASQFDAWSWRSGVRLSF